ncbi:MAG: type II toxin-antitoxin system HigB family toxin [Emcibacter sp.]|nr:type II toxin-antitoxin system HigB family toxin [Emcibacter sp.]
MRIIARKQLVDFGRQHPKAKGGLDSWWLYVKKADWSCPQDVKDALPKASIIANNRVVFYIRGGSYRLIVQFNYPYRIGYIRFIGTHGAYDKIDATGV